MQDFTFLFSKVKGSQQSTWSNYGLTVLSLLRKQILDHVLSTLKTWVLSETLMELQDNTKAYLSDDR